MKRIELTTDNFRIDSENEKEGAQEGYWGTLFLNKKVIYGLVKLDINQMFSFMEYLLSNLAEVMQIPHAEYLPIKVKTEKPENKTQKIIENKMENGFLIGSFSKNFLKDNEKLVSIISLLTEHEASNWDYSMQTFDNFFKKFENYDELIFNFVINVFFSMTFMNADFNQPQNLQLIQNNITGRLSVPPIYDLSANTIFRVLNKNWQPPKLVKMIMRRKNCKTFDAFPMLPDGVEYSFNDAITELTKRFNNIAKAYCEKLSILLNNNSIESIINRMHKDGLINNNNAEITKQYCEICVKDTIRLINSII